jgi:hypothetical protein
VPPPEHPDEPVRRRKRARHEAGHMVTGDKFGAETDTVNVGKKVNEPWKAETRWPAHATPLQKAISVVAGPIAEKEFGEKIDEGVKLVSELITDGNLDGSDRRYASMDVAQTVQFLTQIGQCTRAKVHEAEVEARRLLTKRKAHLDELTDVLDREHYLEAPAIRKALGKDGT